MQGARGALQGGLNLLDLEGVRPPSVRMDLIDFDHGPQPRVPSGGGKVLRWRPGGDPK